MAIEIRIVDTDFSLVDAVAYEFYLDNIANCINPDNTEEDILEAVILLAKSAYLIAEIFAKTREQHVKKTNEQLNDKN